VFDTKTENVNGNERPSLFKTGSSIFGHKHALSIALYNSQP